MLPTSEITVFAILERDSVSTSQIMQFQIELGIVGQLK